MTMSACMKRNGAMLRLLYHAKPAVVKAILQRASPDLLKSLNECALNVLKGNVPLTPAQKKQLSRYKNDLRTVVKKSTSLKKKKNLYQKGGFLGALLRPVISVISNLLGF